MPENERKTFPKTVEVVAPPGQENAQPVQANWISATGGGMFPIAIDFFYLSAAFVRRISSGESGHGIERTDDDRVVCHLPPVARLALSVPSAADLIVSLYGLLQHEETRAVVDRRLLEIAGKPASSEVS